MGQPQKKKLIARERAYHGVTVMAASLTGLPHVHGGFDAVLHGNHVHRDMPGAGMFFQALQQSQPGFSRHHEIGHDNLNGAFLQCLHRSTCFSSAL